MSFLQSQRLFITTSFLQLERKMMMEDRMFTPTILKRRNGIFNISLLEKKNHQVMKVMSETNNYNSQMLST